MYCGNLGNITYKCPLLHNNKKKTKSCLLSQIKIIITDSKQFLKFRTVSLYIFNIFSDLQISHAFPCLYTKSDKDTAAQIESEISKKIEKNKLTLVGWYHSHPFTAAAPTLRDVDAQLDYQIKMKGINDNTYTPCIAVIICKYVFCLLQIYGVSIGMFRQHK